MVAGPLGVSHLLLLSRSDKFVNLKVCRLPRGPTITFHVKSVSVSPDVYDVKLKVVRLSGLSMMYIPP